MQEIFNESLEETINRNLTKMQKVVNNLLARRDYSCFEVEQKLTQKGFDKFAIGCFIQDLQEQNLLNDLRFAESFVRYQYMQGKGENWIIQALKQKGVDDAKIRLALRQEDYELDWQRQIINLINSRKLDLEDVKQKAKALRFLAGRGFTYEQITSAFLTYGELEF